VTPTITDDERTPQRVIPLDPFLPFDARRLSMEPV
jgi:hypothetical protein